MDLDKSSRHIFLPFLGQVELHFNHLPLKEDKQLCFPALGYMHYLFFTACCKFSFELKLLVYAQRPVKGWQTNSTSLSLLRSTHTLKKNLWT